MKVGKIHPHSTGAPPWEGQTSQLSPPHPTINDDRRKSQSLHLFADRLDRLGGVRVDGIQNLTGKVQMAEKRFLDHLMIE